MDAPSAPQSMSTDLISLISASRRGSSTSSNTLYMRRATPARSPASRAAATPAVSGRRTIFRTFTRPKSWGVEMEKGGLQMTIWQGGRGGSGVRRSPLPSARAVPPSTQKGTSEPTRSPIWASSGRDSPAPASSFMAWRTAAASALPPASPAHTGTCLRMDTSTSPPRPVAARKAAAAIWARFFPPVGRKWRSATAVPAPPRAGVTVSSSARETDCITICKSW